MRSRKTLGLLFVLPAMLVLVATVAYPLGSTLVYSVQSLGGTSRVPRGGFVGFANYVAVLRFGDFAGGLTKSTIVTLLSVALTVVFGMMIAVMLNRGFSGRGLARSLVILPWAMPTFVAAFVWRWLLDYSYGAFNQIATALHLVRMPILFLGKNTALLSASIVYTWKGVPWATIVLLAGLQTIPDELRDAARVDGATPWREFWSIILPLLRPVIQISIILLLIWNFNWFEMMWLLTGGGPGSTTAILPIDIYLQAFQEFNLGNASALSVIVLVILLSLAFFMFRVWDRDEAAL